MRDVRTALVTGGSRGIGRACVLEFARRGLNVAFTYNRGIELAEEVLDATRDLPGQVRAFRHELRDGDAPELISGIVAEFGRLDSAVMNAGVWNGGLLNELDADDWWGVVETNLRGSQRLARASLPWILNGPSGSMIFVSSAVALSGFPGDTAYASSKAAMLGFARSLAHEVGGRGVRVNILAPGFVQTEMTSAIPDKSRERILRRTVLRRFGTSEEMARAAVFLSEDATFCTGTLLSADGGWTL